MSQSLYNKTLTLVKNITTQILSTGFFFGERPQYSVITNISHYNVYIGDNTVTVGTGSNPGIIIAPSEKLIIPYNVNMWAIFTTTNEDNAVIEAGICF